MALSHFPGCLSSYCGTNRSFIYSIKFIHFILYYQTLNIIKIACYTETLMKDIHAIWKKAINFSLDISLESMMERRQEITRVMCARWWNRNFQCSCSMETLILITTHAWEFHLGIQGLQQRGHSALLEEKKSNNKCTKDKKNSFTWPTFPLLQGDIAQGKETPSTPRLPHRGRWVWWAPSLPSYVGPCLWGPPFLAPLRTLRR